MVDPPSPLWPPRTRLAFRFGVVYLGLFALATQISGSLTPNLAFTYRGLGRLWPMREITHWVGALLGVAAPLDDVSGGEPLFFWIQTSWILAVSAIAVAVWSRLDRHRTHYAAAYAWFRLAVRLALAASLFEYGMTKVVPTQFPAPSLTTLVTPVGDLTLSALLWTSIGASTPYQVFTGCIEILAGILLLLPQTTLLGALLGVAALGQVFALNMSYDVGLKAITFHLIVLAFVLIAPHGPRLADLFLRQRPAYPRGEPALARSPRGRRVAALAPLAIGAYLLGMYGYINWSFWQAAGGGSPRSALYGIWEVETLSLDGARTPPHEADYDRRWRRVIFDEPGAVVFQRTDDSFARYGASIDASRGRLALTKGGSRRWQSAFTYERPSSDRLLLEGEMDGRRVGLRLRRVEPDTWRLLNSHFRWVRPHDP